MAKNHYTDEFEQQIVSLYKTGKTPEQLVNYYQIKTKDNRTPEENGLLIELRKEVKQLRMENDILKQTALIIGKK